MASRDLKESDVRSVPALHVQDQASADAYDRLVAETIEGIKANEPRTLVYAVHTVKDQPLQRILYELYRDEEAFKAHGAARTRVITSPSAISTWPAPKSTG